MHRSHDNPLLRHMLLISALLVGSAATLFVPPYHEIAAAPDDEQPVSAQATPDSTTSGMTGIDVNPGAGTLFDRHAVRNRGLATCG